MRIPFVLSRVSQFPFLIYIFFACFGSGIPPAPFSKGGVEVPPFKGDDRGLKGRNIKKRGL